MVHESNRKSLLTQVLDLMARMESAIAAKAEELRRLKSQLSALMENERQKQTQRLQAIAASRRRNEIERETLHRQRTRYSTYTSSSS